MEATQESQSGWYTGQTRDVAIMYTALFMTFIFKLLLCRFRWLLYIKWQHNRQWHWPWKGWVSTAADNFSVNGMPLHRWFIIFLTYKILPSMQWSSCDSVQYTNIASNSCLVQFCGGSASVPRGMVFPPVDLSSGTVLNCSDVFIPRSTYNYYTVEYQWVVVLKC